jgi:prepilin-type N-terminal cleavage/methylation domain-containing protein
MKTPRLNSARAAFTLIELLIVVTIIALLFALTVGGFSYAQRSAARSKTAATIKAVQSALERYNTEFGEYPEPANPGDTISLRDKTYTVAGAAMLYQAMSGDGFDAIKITAPPANAGPSQSDGNIDPNEAKNIMLTDMPKEVWRIQDGRYFMIDGFGNPLQYIRAAPQNLTGAAAVSPTTINTNYDIWSYGEDEDNTMATSLETNAGGPLKQASEKWIKNW